jgi:tRNA (guanine-N(7)-)-methyltransferase
MTHVIRTFKPRRRKLSASREESLARLGPQRCLSSSGDAFNAESTFGRIAKLVFEIGIGFGESIVQSAQNEPGTDWIGADVHTPGIAATLEQIESLDLTNIRLVHGDALEFLDRMPRSSLHGVQIYFPDPWPKVRHSHRRLVSDDVVARLVMLLDSNGWIAVATDDAEYARHAQRALDACAALSGGIVPRLESRALTRYESKSRVAGRKVVDLVYNRSPD